MPKLDELVAPGRAAVLTMEMQRGVIGDLATIPALAGVINEQGVPARLGSLVESARRAEIPVMVNHLLKNPDHMLINEPSVDVIPELGPEPADFDSVRVHGMSPFTGTNLDPTLRSLGVETVIATGVSLNVGILGVVIEAINHGYHVVLVTDCVAGYPPEYAEAVLEHSLARITTQTTAEELQKLWS